ncbi:class I SAM-dependent methyltransferase [Desulfovibrio cuneatus]|uniref:class I SAM-dependent methyltransferase n=1 Tax=Desulfovibrio cuneatus TaxID=159728 RepID=UPI0003F8C1B7|nr:class I SAM-dependent methyltransferase [Desulfovibrio cuneatus]
MPPKDPYQHIAPVYDTITAKALAYSRQAIAMRCSQLYAKRVLDVGCGTGKLVQYLQSQGIFAVGMDASPAMLQAQAVHNRAKGYPAPLLPCVQANAAHPPFAQNTFDIVVFSLILHETGEDPAALLQQGLQLAPRALVLEWRAPERNLDYLFCLWPHFIERMAGKEHYTHFRAFIRQGGMAGLAHRAGARITHCQRLAAHSMGLYTLEHLPIEK